MSNFNLIEQKHLWPVHEQHESICLELLDLKTYSTYEHGITLSVYQVSNAYRVSFKMIGIFCAEYSDKQSNSNNQASLNFLTQLRRHENCY